MPGEIERGRGGKFVKGNKGGPGGARPLVGRKPDDVAKFRQDLRDGFGFVLAKIKKHAESKNEEVSIRACIWWADQVVGKAVQNVTVDSGGAQVSTIAECDQAIVAAIRERGKKILKD